MTRFRVGVDIGGTFTDIVFLGEGGERFTKKVSSTVDNYATAIVDGLSALIAERGLSSADIVELLHGTTVASNAILELKGAAYRADHHARLPRRAGDPHAADAAALRPVVDQAAAAGRAPSARRGRRADRCQGRGGTPSCDEADVERAVRLSAGREGRGDRRLPAALLPQPGARADGQADRRRAWRRRCSLCISAEVLPEIKEYERTSTTVINAYVRPIVEELSVEPDRRAEADRGRAPLLLMQSNGGLTTAAAAVERPMNIIESGPAAGVVGVQALVRQIGIAKAISFDMGGTTAKASLIENGEVTRANEYSVGGGIMVGSRLLSGAGYTLKVPAIDLAEVGAGGGSLLWIDAGGAMQVGPQSAGASPGPVCYDAGRHRADRDRRQCRARLHQPASSGRRRAEAQADEGARGDRADDRRVRSA